jgi:hypothetical protein
MWQSLRKTIMESGLPDSSAIGDEESRGIEGHKPYLTPGSERQARAVSVGFRYPFPLIQRSKPA